MEKRTLGFQWEKMVFLKRQVYYATECKLSGRKNDKIPLRFVTWNLFKKC